MLKKAGIIVAASAAAILAASPLALADSFDHSPHCKSGKQVADNSVRQAADATSPVLGLVGVLAAGNAAAPINAQVQGPIGSCNNVEHVLNVHVHDVLQNGSRNVHH